MSTPTPPLTEPELADYERHCTTQKWPAHDWQPAMANARATVCSHCNCYASADPQRVLLPCFHRGEPLSPPSALRLVAEVRRWRTRVADVEEEKSVLRAVADTLLQRLSRVRSTATIWDAADERLYREAAAALGWEVSEL